LAELSADSSSTDPHLSPHLSPHPSPRPLARNVSSLSRLLLAAANPNIPLDDINIDDVENGRLPPGTKIAPFMPTMENIMHLYNAVWREKRKWNEFDWNQYEIAEPGSCVNGYIGDYA
jgi:hypothetical protein